MLSGVELYYQEGRDKVRFQDEHRRELIGKAFTTLNLSIALIAVGVLVLNLAISGSDLKDIEISRWVAASGSVVLLFWLGVVFQWYRVVEPDTWNDGSNLDSLSEAIPEHSTDDVLGFLADNYRLANAENRDYLNRKVSAVKWAAIWLFFQAGSIIAFASFAVTEL